MQKEKWQVVFASSILTCILLIVLVAACSSVYDYYTGPVRLITLYTNALNERAYDKAYDLLDPCSIEALGTKAEIVAYYEKLYKGHLVEVQDLGKPKMLREYATQLQGAAKGDLYYIYSNHRAEQNINMVKRQNKWYICFPFETKTVTIEAPEGSKVYFNDEVVHLKQGGSYTVEHVLPGNYYIQVILPHAAYEDYFTVIKVPEQTEVILPYKLANLTVQTVKGMEVQLGNITKHETGKGVHFNQVLPGTYHLTIRHPLGLIQPLEEDVMISGDKQIVRHELVLSDKGEHAYNGFFKAFYNDYLTSIKAGDLEAIEKDLEGSKKEEMLEQFSSWFINEKQVADARINIAPISVKLDESGYLWTDVFETVELDNLEEIGEKTYQLQLKWHMQLTMRAGVFKVVDRTLIESLVAYKDKDDRWIQY